MTQRTLYADDCLQVLQNSKALPTESVDLIYLDPPFNSQSKYNLPFDGKYKTVKPVEAFKDTWTWGDTEEEGLEHLSRSHHTKILADIIRTADWLSRSFRKYSLPAYLLNMSMRLLAMYRVLKPTGTLYLHCDPTASHYLKLVLDSIFGRQHFRNEIVWCYAGGGIPKNDFPRKHDIILRYTKSQQYQYFPIYRPYSPGTLQRGRTAVKGKYFEQGLREEGTPMNDWWADVPKITSPTDSEKMGYPTQKSLALLERIISASSKEGDLILDPFCGCGTTMHAAEALDRQWIGIDISAFSVGLVRERITTNFPEKDLRIETHGTPYDVPSAKALARKDPFEFEKWVCGAIGAHGMFHDPGTKGRDSGVDGVIEFGLYQIEAEPPRKEYAIVQVKGGKVSPDNVKALWQTVEDFKARAGIFVCFKDYLPTVELNRKRGTYSDLTGSYPIIQGFSIEQLLKKEKPDLPPLIFRKDANLKQKKLGPLFDG